MTEPVGKDEGGASSAPLWIAAVIVLAGVAGYYVMSTQPWWVRWGSVVAGLVIGGVVVITSPAGKALWQFVLDARNELRKVFWPGKNETWITTALVFGFAAIAGLFFWLLDALLAWATRLLTGQGG